jgi:hypothetical protein
VRGVAGAERERRPSPHLPAIRAAAASFSPRRAAQALSDRRRVITLRVCRPPFSPAGFGRIGRLVSLGARALLLTAL